MRALNSALLALSVMSGCAHRGLGYPGPTVRMGGTPPAYASTLEVEEDTREPEEAHAEPPRRLARRGGRDGRDVATAAGALVGCRKLSVGGETYRWDCSGMVMAAYAKADEALTGNSKALWEQAKEAGVLHKRKEPALGDVAFFDNTYDRNRNGRRDDKLTHVAVVEEVAPDGTITLVHLGSKGVVRILMNMHHPGERTDEAGQKINSYLRASSGKDGGKVLSGDLCVGFGSLWKLDDGGLADNEG